jgi:cytochrome c peroxidase
MKFAISFLLALAVANSVYAASLEEFVRSAAIRNGFKPPSEINPKFDPQLAALGGVYFGSKALSLNGDIACTSCHLDKFGSADGIPNAIGVGGVGEGADRVNTGGAVIPRNTLPLWGRGSKIFKTFFWDGKVDFANKKRISQFGNKTPSDDPLVVAVLLPFVEIREMLVDDKFVTKEKREEVGSAIRIYKEIIKKLFQKHPDEMARLASALGKPATDLSVTHVATAIAEFIRKKFAVRDTKFSKFVFERGSLSEQELRGAHTFYGKGKCSICHSGPLFSNRYFHAIPFTQIGFGKNGFGVDYGRFNVTHDPNDLYKFRTPPLLNVTKTAPYGHSGLLPTLEAAITQHFDPLRNIRPQEMEPLERSELYKRIAASSSSVIFLATLTNEDVANLVAFLRTIEF